MLKSLTKKAEAKSNSPVPSSPKAGTFYQNLAIPYKKAVNTIAVDSTGKFVCLGGYNLNIIFIEKL
jgi:hypothetical protein